MFNYTDLFSYVIVGIFKAIDLKDGVLYIYRISNLMSMIYANSTSLFT